MSDDIEVTLTVNDPQGLAVMAACELYARTALGQLERIADLVRDGIIPMSRDVQEGRATASVEQVDAIEEQLKEVKRVIGYHPNSSLGLGHPHVHEIARHAWEARKVIRTTLLAQDGNDLDAVTGIKLDGTQAQAIAEACDFHARICLGDLQEVVNLMRSGVVCAHRPANEERVRVSFEELDKANDHLAMAKFILGFRPNSSLGVGHPHLDPSANRTWEVKKAVEQALAYHRNPSPEFKGVNYDGNIVRYTRDPAPRVVVSEREPTQVPGF
jgi:hypothetical protein